ncbi:MAG: AIPR family protein [Bryobacteraceae bacterium]
MISRFGGLVDLSDVQSASKDQLEAFRLTRSLAAFAVAELGGVDDTPAAQAVTDGAQDNGIDAVYFDPVEHNCFLVQSKWTSSGNGSVELGDVLKFLQGVRDLLEAKFDEFNSKMAQHQEMVFSALSDTSTRFTLVLAYTGEQSLSSDVQKPLNELMAELNSPSEIASVEVLNQGRLHSIVATGVSGEAVDLDVMLHHWGLVKEPYVAYYGQVAVSVIAAWGTYGVRLTSKNLRQFKGLTEINESIGKTLSTSPEKFWYYKNGITILCESVKKKPLGGSTTEIGTFECKGASVVNGAQTVGTIVTTALKEDGKLGGARVLVRLISLDNCPPNFADELTRATNTQNRIERRDFAALDPNQKRLRTELLLEFRKNMHTSQARLRHRRQTAAP